MVRRKTLRRNYFFHTSKGICRTFGQKKYGIPSRGSVLSVHTKHFATRPSLRRGSMAAMISDSCHSAFSASSMAAIFFDTSSRSAFRRSILRVISPTRVFPFFDDELRNPRLFS